MDDNEYRRLVSGPDVMKRTDLRATYSRLQGPAPDLAALVQSLLLSPSVPKPPEWVGTRDDEFVYLDLAEDDIEAIHDALRDQEIFLAQHDVLTDNEAASLRWVARLADLWNEAESVRPQAN